MVTSDDVRRYDVVILGGGYAGLMAAFRLGRKRQTLRIALINGSDQFLERVRLQESIISEVNRRIPSISMLLAGTRVEFICGLIASLDANRRRVSIVSTAESRRSRSMRPSTRLVRAPTWRACRASPSTPIVWKLSRGHVLLKRSAPG